MATELSKYTMQVATVSTELMPCGNQDTIAQARPMNIVSTADHKPP